MNPSGHRTWRRCHVHPGIERGVDGTIQRPDATTGRPAIGRGNRGRRGATTGHRASRQGIACPAVESPVDRASGQGIPWPATGRQDREQCGPRPGACHAPLHRIDCANGSHRPPQRLPLRDDPRQLTLRVIPTQGGDGRAAAVDSAAYQGNRVADGAVAVAREDARPEGMGAAQAAQILAAEAFQEIEQAGVAGAVDTLPAAALAPDPLDQGLDLDLQGGAGEVAAGVAEGGARRLAQVVDGAVEEIDVLSAITAVLKTPNGKSVGIESDQISLPSRGWKSGSDRNRAGSTAISIW